MFVVHIFKIIIKIILCKNKVRKDYSFFFLDLNTDFKKKG